MNLDNVTYRGPAIDDEAILEHVPRSLAGLLRQINGFIQHHGGVHVRGACLVPEWHSLRAAWHGEHALHRSYLSMEMNDVPFAEDCLGDQFFLRDGLVWKLSAETDEVESLGISLGELLRRIGADPLETLAMHPLMRFIKDERHGLAPGELLAAYPPFCLKESAGGVTLRAVATLERRRFLAELAASIRDVPDGEKISFKLVD